MKMYSGSSLETRINEITSVHLNEMNKEHNNITSIEITSVPRAHDSWVNNETKNESEVDKNESIMNRIGKSFVFSITTVAVPVLFVIPWSTIPRTNSIIYQSSWMEITLPMSTILILVSATDLLNLTIWTKESSIMSLYIYVKMVSVYLLPMVLINILFYIIWTVYLDYKHPIPFLGLIGPLPVQIFFLASLWCLLPTKLAKKEDFRRKLKIYTGYFFWGLLIIVQNDVLTFLFTNFLSELQFLVAFMVAGCREFDKRVRTKMVNMMMGEEDEPATALISITISSTYSFFIALRLTGANIETVFCFLAIDFFLHSRMTYKLIKAHKNRVNNVNLECESRTDNIIVKKLIIAELVEGFTPIIYGISIALAFYGPNAEILANIGSNFWGKPIDDIYQVVSMMLLLFAVDTISAVINSICIWKATKIDMLQEFCCVLRKYWYFMAIKLSYTMAGYFMTNDINLGLDTSGKFEWITPEGRLSLIGNASDLTFDGKFNILINNTLI